MQTDVDRAVADAVRPREGAAPCPVRWVPLRELRTSFAGLRRGRVGGPRADATWPPLAELPLRVVRVGALPGYEVVDGFKRLERWRDEGATHVPVLVETACDAHEAKRLLLVTNAPRRTVSVLDEARVADALRAEGLGPKAIGKSRGQSCAPRHGAARVRARPTRRPLGHHPSQAYVPGPRPRSPWRACSPPS